MHTQLTWSGGWHPLRAAVVRALHCLYDNDYGLIDIDHGEASGTSSGKPSKTPLEYLQKLCSAAREVLSEDARQQQEQRQRTESDVKAGKGKRKKSKQDDAGGSLQVRYSGPCTLPGLLAPVGSPFRRI